LLWLCDLNFVRGEDSFVRAQWAARPLVWQIYPQQEARTDQARRLSGALLRALPPTAGCLLCEFWQAWNAGRVETALAATGRKSAELREHAMRWDEGSRCRTICSAGCYASVLPSYNQHLSNPFSGTPR
jgi:hypothetical protein